MKNKNGILGKSSPNRITWIYYSILENLVKKVGEQSDISEVKNTTLLCILLSVNLVETFLNVYFRIKVEEISHAGKAKKIKEIEIMGLEWKLDHLTVIYFSKKIDFSRGIGQQFKKLKDLRNDLMHYKPTFETIKIPQHGIELAGLTDTSVYDLLSKDKATECLETVENFIAEILFVGGCPQDLLKHQLHRWLGKVQLV